MPTKLTTKDAFKIDGELLSLSENTRGTYTRAIQAFYDFFEIDIYHIRQIKKQHIVRFQQHLFELNYAASTINLYLDGIKYLFKATKRIVPDFNNPFDSLDDFRLKQQQSEIRVLTSYQANKLLKYFKQNHNYKIYILCKLILYTGLRITEALQLRRINIIDRGERKSFIKFFGKGKKQRLVPLSPKIYLLIMDYLKDFGIDKPDNILFTYKRTYISNVVGAACKKIFKMKGFGVHGLRHTFATLYYRNYPEKLQQLSDMLGHKSADYTRRKYIHVVEPLKGGEVDKLFQ